MWIFTVPPPQKKRTLNKSQEEINPSKHPPIHTVSIFLDQAIFEPFFPWYYVYFFPVLQWQQEPEPCPAPPSVPLHAPISVVHWSEYGGHNIWYRILQNLLWEGHHTREYIRLFTRPKPIYDLDIHCTVVADWNLRKDKLNKRFLI